MKIDQRRCAPDIKNSLKRGAVLGAKIEAAGRLGKKLTGFLRSDVLQEKQ